MFDEFGEGWNTWAFEGTKTTWEDIMSSYYYSSWNSKATKEEYPFLHEPLMTTMTAVNNEPTKIQVWNSTAEADGGGLNKWAEIDSLEPMQSLTYAYIAKFPVLK